MMRHAPATLVVFLGALALVGWFAPDVLLVVFAGSLLAVALRAGACPLARWLGIGEGWAVMLVALAAAAALGTVVWFGFDSFSEQVRQFSTELPKVMRRIVDMASGLPGADWLKGHLSSEQAQPSAQAAASVAMAGVSGTLGALGNFLLVVLLGIYIAADPTLYRRGALALLSPGLRPRGEATLNAMAHTLRGWLLGQLFAMVVSGILTFLGLWALGVPLAGLLAFLTALFGFMPYIGPVIGCVPAVLIASSHDPSLVPWVIGLYLAVQNVEGNFLTPLVQQQSSDVPPAVLLGAQALLGTGLGFLGILLAAPLAAAAMAAFRVAYVEGWVEAPQDKPHVEVIRVD
jgi:predicted PurR-regulated permease PerM